MGLFRDFLWSQRKKNSYKICKIAKLHTRARTVNCYILLRCHIKSVLVSVNQTVSLMSFFGSFFSIGYCLYNVHNNSFDLGLILMVWRRQKRRNGLIRNAMSFPLQWHDSPAIIERWSHILYSFRVFWKGEIKSKLATNIVESDVWCEMGNPIT